MRKTVAVLAVALTMAGVPALAGQDSRLPQAEQDADRIEAQALYERQRQRDQQEADRVAKTNLDRQTDYDLYVARQKAEYEAKMAQWRADVARQRADAARARADWEAKVAQCKAGERSACAPR